MSDFATLKNYGDITYKVTHLKHRSEGAKENRKYTEKGTAGNETKLANNLSRAKSCVYEYAYCNSWDYFVTLTFDNSLHDRSDLPALMKSFTQYIRDLRKKGYDIAYLLIPELHKDGKSWHLHGFLRGLPASQVKPLKGRLPKRLRDMINSGRKLYTWTGYAEKFGFCDLEPVQNIEAASKYVLKYITKDMTRTVRELNAHMYYASQGLNRAMIECAGEMVRGLEYNPFRHDERYYENEYVVVKEYHSHEAALRHFFEEATPDYASIALSV